MGAFEVEDGTGQDDVGNYAGGAANPLAGGGGGSDAIAANENEMTEQEMEDLTYAFQAADMDRGGAIDFDEFSLMLAVMGSTMTPDQVRGAMATAKAGFKQWMEMADAENVAKCQVIWDDYDDDNSGTMDLGEINNVIDALRNIGSDLPTFTKEQVDNMSSAGDGELNFAEFSRWYLQQQGLPDEFSAPKKGHVGGGGPAKEKGAVGKLASKASSIAIKPIAGLTKTVVSSPAELLRVSVRQNSNVDKGAEGFDEEQAAREMLEQEGEIIFAEFAYMMRGGDLKEFLPGDWQERAEDMCKLREAFDTADVDGDNQLELEELEMVVVAMNPKADVSPADIQKVWAVLNPEGKEWIPFGEYVEGMIEVKNDPFLSTVVPMDVPNRFQLLSLLIDTPINEDQEKLIYANCDPLTKAGIGLLKKMGSEEQTKEDIRKTLDQACAGRLHYLTPAQRANVTSVHFWCVFQAFMIAGITCGIAGAWENYLTGLFQTDGALDLYSSCPDFFADVDNPSSEYYNLSLPSNPEPWNGLGFTGDDVLWSNHQQQPISKWDVNYALDAYRQGEDCVPAALEEDGSLPDCSFTPGDAASCKTKPKKGAACIYTPPKDPKGECLPGTCAAYPKNITEYLQMGGNAVMGGTWNATKECWTPGFCTSDRSPVSYRSEEADCLAESPPGKWDPIEDDAATDDDESLECWPGECAPLRKTTVWRPYDVGIFMPVNIAMVVLMIVFELSGLMYTALRSAVKVSKALDLRLTPINADRAFVAKMLVRSVFELPDEEGEVMGVDAGGGEDEVSRPLLINILAVAWIKGRVLISGIVFKMITCMYFNWDSATWLKPWLGTAWACMLWDAMLCHAIMKGAEVQAIGVTTSVEVFNEIMDTFCPEYENDPSSLSDKARVQILRAIGVAIVKHGSMFPTMELLLRHAVNYLDMKKHKAVSVGGIIDDEEGWVEDFKEITLDESRAVLCTHMLCYVLDGFIGVAETSMWKKLLERVEECYQIERTNVEAYNDEQMREFIVMKMPKMKSAVSRIPMTGRYKNDYGRTEREELAELMTYVDVRAHRSLLVYLANPHQNMNGFIFTLVTTLLLEMRRWQLTWVCLLVTDAGEGNGVQPSPPEVRLPNVPRQPPGHDRAALLMHGPREEQGTRLRPNTTGVRSLEISTERLLVVRCRISWRRTARRPESWASCLTSLLSRSWTSAQLIHSLSAGPPPKWLELHRRRCNESISVTFQCNLY